MKNSALDLKLETLEVCEVLSNGEYGIGYAVGVGIVVVAAYGAGTLIVAT